MDEKSTEFLQGLRDLTQMTGALHPVQEHNLKMWSMVMVAHAESSVIKYDGEKREVEFWISATRQAPSNLTKALKFLGKSTQNLLGENYLVRVYINDRIVYTCKRDKAIKKPINEAEGLERTSWAGLLKDE